MMCQSNLTSGFIDLASYDELEKYMYGGSDSIAYFVRETRKATWFTQVPVQLAKCEGVADFGQDWSVSISRSGDYLLGTWLHVALPAVSVAGYNGRSVCVAWTPNFMHALIKSCTITFNDLCAAKFDGTHLDFWAAFTTPMSKAEGYRQMIGSQIPTCGGFIPARTLDLPLPFFYTRDSGLALPTAALPYNEMRINFSFRDWQELLVGFAPKVDCYNYAVSKNDSTNTNPYIVPVFNSSASGIQPSWNSDIWPSCGPGETVCDQSPDEFLQLPDLSDNCQRFGYKNSSELSFIILPKLDGPPLSYLAQVGNNEVTQEQGGKTNYDISQYNLPHYVGTPSGKGDNGIYCTLKELELTCQVWANYAIVSNEERKKMTCAPRDMLIEQVQSSPPVDFDIKQLPDSQWWPNNIPKLKKNDTNLTNIEPTNQIPKGTGTGACGPNATDTPDNQVPAGEINWPTGNLNVMPQQPSGQGHCIGNDYATHEELTDTTYTFGDNDCKWTLDNTPDFRRSTDCQDSSGATVTINLKYSHAVKAIFFGVKNVTAPNIHSNYTIGFPVLQAAATDQVTLDGPVFGIDTWNKTTENSWNSTDKVCDPFYKPVNGGGISKFVGRIQTLTQSVITCKNGFDPIEKMNILYETTPRLGLLDASYYSLTQPYYHAPVIPSSMSPVFCPTGYHMYSYSLDFNSLDPLGSTNYGKLTNVSLQAEPIKLNSSNICPLLSYAVPNVNEGNSVNSRYVFGPINGPGTVGKDANSLKNQSVLEVLINMAYQNVYSEIGLETVSPWATENPIGGMSTTKCTYLGQFKFVSTAITNNVLRISGGSIGFPVL